VTAVLEVADVTVRFGGRRALDRVSLDADAGAVTGIIGPNGAGKTTLFDVVSGLRRPGRGRVRLAGADVTGLGPARRARRGLGRTFQRLELFTMLSVRDNVAVAVETHRAWSGRHADTAARVDELLAAVGLTERADERVTALPTGQARLVELARALATDPAVLLLDEPAAGQTDAETVRFADLLRHLAADGRAVVLVDHDMRLVMDVCDRLHVLDLGRVLASGEPAAIRDDPAVHAAYLGRPQSGTAAPSATADRPAPAPPPALLELRGIRAGYEGIEVLGGIDLDVATGTVHAVLGPNGAGKTTLLDVVAGLHAPTAGSVTLAGERIDGLPTAGLARTGVCLVPEGRGVFPNLTVAENLWMATHVHGDRAAVEQAAFARFPALAARRAQPAGTLSGGEQQMLALARALATDPALLLLDELSMGLAPLIVGELYDHVARLAEEGVTILVVEQFAHAVLGVADAVTVLTHGRVSRRGRPDDLAGTLMEDYLGG
jgi:ABC-type branched-subunit amino acid transport system ATPase component